MSATSTDDLYLRREIWKSTGRLFKTNSTHFHVLSILFLLPIFFSLVVYPSFHLALFHPDFNFFTTQFQFSFSFIEIIVPIIYTLVLLLFFLFAVATITYSAVEVFHGRPINLLSSIKSVRNCFFPLLSTLIVSQTIFISIALVFALVLLFTVQILQTLGLIELKYDFNQLSILGIFTSIVLVPIFIWLKVNWSLAYVIAVVESKWGFESLRKSAHLIKGKKWVVFWIALLFELVIGTLMIAGSFSLVISDAAKGDNWKNLWVILQIVECSLLGFVAMNQYLVMNVVLYMYCNGFNGEKLPLEIGDDEYVSLLLDDKENRASVTV